jgi:hypothetical protein
MTATSDALVQAAQALSFPELEHLVDRLVVLRTRRAIEDSRTSEADLITLIHEAVPSVLLRRSGELRAKRRAGKLAETERDELVRLTDLIEQLNAQRVLHLAQLAHLRGVTLEQAMAELGIHAPAIE